MPSWRKIKQEIQTTSDRYLVAVSGGIDSMFLLDFMLNANANIEVVHFNHGIRSDSTIDQNLVRTVAKSNNLPFWTADSSSLLQTADENSARTERWSYIEQVARMRDIKCIVTAHHADDQIENVLIRLMRGDPHHALCMTKLVERNGFIRYKPLLEVRKQAIKYQANARGLRWVEDSTNESDRYDRNFIRNTVLPLLSTRTNVYQSILTGIDKTYCS